VSQCNTSFSVFYTSEKINSATSGNHCAAVSLHQVTPGSHRLVLCSIGPEAGRQAFDLGIPVRLLEKNKRHSRFDPFFPGFGKDDSMKRRNPETIGPAFHQISNVDNNFRIGADYRNPLLLAVQDFKTRTASVLKE